MYNLFFFQVFKPEIKDELNGHEQAIIHISSSDEAGTSG